jgi:hypothetical protein
MPRQCYSKRENRHLGKYASSAGVKLASELFEATRGRTKYYKQKQTDKGT